MPRSYLLNFPLPLFSQVLNKVCIFIPFVYLFSSNATVNVLVQILPTLVIFSKIVLQPLKFLHLFSTYTRLIFLKFTIYHITSLLKNSSVGHNFIQYKTQNWVNCTLHDVGVPSTQDFPSFTPILSNSMNSKYL